MLTTAGFYSLNTSNQTEGGSHFTTHNLSAANTRDNSSARDDSFSGVSAVLFTSLYGIICVLGLLGNGLVIFVVVRFAKMKTVPNIYILNLAVSDTCFLIGLPFLITTGITRFWVFGFVMCKVFYILTSINWFTSVFTLTVMSIDRYLAVCHAVKSMNYRTPLVSAIVCVCIWTLSFLVMLPIILYTTTAKGTTNKPSCTIIWPEGQPVTSKKAFIWYTFLLGYAIPVFVVVVLYTLVLSKVKRLGPKVSNRSREKRKSHRKVTRLVLIVVAVYIICWLPYWVFQMELTINGDINMASWKVFVFQLITCMSYANSMLNPVIYAFLSENFRESFLKAFRCTITGEVNAAFQAQLHQTHSSQPPRVSRLSPRHPCIEDEHWPAGAGTSFVGQIGSMNGDSAQIIVAPKETILAAHEKGTDPVHL